VLKAAYTYLLIATGYDACVNIIIVIVPHEIKPKDCCIAPRVSTSPGNTIDTVM